MQENKINFKKLLKKGNQKFKSFLGFIETIKENGEQFVLTLKKTGGNTGVFLLGILVWPFVQIKKFLLFLFTTGKNTWEQIKCSFYKTLGVLVAMFCVSATLFLILLIILHYNPKFIEVLNLQFILTNENYKPETLSTLNQLIAQGKIISAGEVYNHVLEYYNTLITILLASLGVFGFISWFSIQSKIKHEAELSVENKFESKDFQCRLQDEIEEAAKETLDEGAYIARIAEDNADLIINRLLCSNNFTNKIKEIIQNFQDDKNIKSKKLEGIEDGDKV